MKYNIIRNMARCLICFETIESKSVHDFVSCSCGNLSVDGGHDYLRRVFKDYTMVEELSVTKDFPKNNS